MKRKVRLLQTFIDCSGEEGPDKVIPRGSIGEVVSDEGDHLVVRFADSTLTVYLNEVTNVDVMKFQDIPIGQWFDFSHHVSGTVNGPFKKTASRAYLYHTNLGWYETKIGSSRLEVITVSRPDYAPDEEVNVFLRWELQCYHSRIVIYPISGNPTEDTTKYLASCPSCQAKSDSEKDRKKARKDSIAIAREFAVGLVSAGMANGVRAEKVVIFVDDGEQLIFTSHNNKAKARRARSAT